MANAKGDDKAGAFEPEEYLYKVLVVGEPNCGKTNFIKRYVHDTFSTSYKTTIGVDFALKVLNWDDGRKVIRLQLWDIAGQERHGNMTRVYYKEAAGAFIVFDATRPTTFEAVSKWKIDIDKKVFLPDEQSIPIVLLANKCDLPRDPAIKGGSEMDDYCTKNGYLCWFDTSAKCNVNISEAANALVAQLVQLDADTNRTQHPRDQGSVSLTNLPPKQKGGCAC